MKKFLLLCLLGLGMLLPANTITAKEVTKNVLAKSKIINVTLQGNVLLANSGMDDGPILGIVIRTVPGGKMMLQQECGDYSCSVNVSCLPAGNYVAQVYLNNQTYTWQFKK